MPNPSLKQKLVAAAPLLGGLALAQGVVLFVLMIGTNSAVDDQSDGSVTQVNMPTPQSVYDDSIQPLLAKFCYDCHNADKDKGDIDLTPHTAVADIRRHRREFVRVWEMLNTFEMPPKKKPQPTADERAKMIGFIETELARLDCDGPKDPGRVVVRRLSRFEYRNTIRDLVGVEYDPTDEFPMDDIGYGFDNIGDVMSLPPLLMEKYLAASEWILNEAIVTERTPKAWSQRVLAVNLKGEYPGRPDGTSVWFYANGEAHTEIEFPADGRYLIRVNASGDPAVGVSPQMSLKIDGRSARTFDVDAPRHRPGRYETKVTAKAGRRRISIGFTNDYYNPKAADRKDRDRNLVVVYLEVLGPVDQPPKDLTDSHRNIFVATPGGGVSPRDAADKILRHFATRAFRRPIRDDEAARFITLFDLAVINKANFESAVQLMLQGVLVSPKFLFRIEADTNSDDTIVAVDDYALATRLSYFLWASMPDPQLFDLAASGELSQPDVLEAQVRRMIADKKSRRFAANFAPQWLQVRRIDEAAPDEKLFPTFDDDLRRAMVDETIWFFDAIMREDRPLTQLLDARFTYANETLAKHYGIIGVKGDAMRRVPLTDPNRGGVLTMAAPLTVTSHARHTSPVKRGKWVLEAILGTPPPPPSPDAGELDDTVPVDSGLTMRERFEQHRADSACAICHRRIDPLGFGFETFDPVGRYRTEADGKPVDTRGTLLDGRSFTGPAELKKVLIEDRDVFTRALAEKMLTYAIGRGLEHYDACAIKQITDGTRDADYRFSAMVSEIVRSLPFRYRRATAQQNTELTEVE